MTAATEMVKVMNTELTKEEIYKAYIDWVSLKLTDIKNMKMKYHFN